jgi:hypothetical protein
MKATLKVVRDTYRPTYTLGRLYINDVFFCDTVEDAVRDINKDGDLSDKGEAKVYGETAIPSGTYKMIINMSNRFRKMMPLLIDVKGFEGIRIHAGNKASDSHGCILVGFTRTKDGVGQSRLAFESLMYKLERYNSYEVIIKDL